MLFVLCSLWVSYYVFILREAVKIYQMVLFWDSSNPMMIVESTRGLFPKDRQTETGTAATVEVPPEPVQGLF